MQIIRFETGDGRVCLGAGFDGARARVLSGDLFADPENGLTPTGEEVEVKRLLAPLDPAAVFCIGLNYRRHARETGFDLPRYPVVFMKNPGAVTGPGAPIVIPPICLDPPEVDFEAELGVVIGRAGVNIPEDQALDHVLGYVTTNDISARRWQKHAGGGQWVRAKSYDSFCPMGPFLSTDIKDPQDLEIQCRVNGELFQNSNTRDMIFSVAHIISYLSQSTTLLPGTLILTGTPEGVGYTRKPPVYLKPGDHLETRIQDLGILENPVTEGNSCHGR